jgi:CMP-2-keto-3-deoxyoctulosonic acid synthetase
LNPIVVIPARMASTRLPGKPLADINGKPMIVHMLERGREAGIGPVAVACGDPEIADAVREATTVSFVKTACAFEDGQTIAPALYFSRQAIPWGLGPRWHHVGIYAYRRTVLDRYVSLPPSPLERRENLEQLRALENGMRIACVRMQHGPFGVDTAEDLERARALVPHS